jgi:translation initiation factor 1
MATSTRSSLVYSTDAGRMCPECRQPLAACACAANAAQARRQAGDGIVRVSRETKGRGGKTTTVVRGVAWDLDATAALAKRLRTGCGAGGTVKDGVIEVQGDHVDLVIAKLTGEGLKVRRTGG